MVWLALALILLSLIITKKISSQKLTTAEAGEKIENADISPIIGLSAILIGVTIMIGYIVVSCLGRLGIYLSETLKAFLV